MSAPSRASTSVVTAPTASVLCSAAGRTRFAGASQSRTANGCGPLSERPVPRSQPPAPVGEGNWDSPFRTHPSNEFDTHFRVRRVIGQASASRVVANFVRPNCRPASQQGLSRGRLLIRGPQPFEGRDWRATTEVRSIAAAIGHRRRHPERRRAAQSCSPRSDRYACRRDTRCRIRPE